jgi:Transposase DDE domain group 1
MLVATPPHVTLDHPGPQQLQITFDGPRIVSDVGLLAVRDLDRRLGVLAGLAELFPDPRALKYRTHSTEALLTQQVYQLLAGYPDCDDANTLRTDPLFQILADVAPDPERPLASGSTLARFQYAFTRRQAELPLEERPVLLEVRHAQCERLKRFNRYLVGLFVRTRRTPPSEIIVDIDATDDPVHGGQHLAAYHGYYKQHQYLPLLVYEGHSGFPLAVWLRPGAVHASCGAVAALAEVVAALRAAWPGVRIVLRGDSGLAVPDVYAFCEAEDLSYALGYGSNPVLERATAQALADVELYYAFYGRREPHVQRFEELPGYQAGTWPHPRRVVAKIEHTPQGSQRRFVVTNLPDRAEVVYRDFYVQRGAVPEQPIGELKNGLHADRLSAHKFCANALRLCLHVVAQALVVLWREAAAAAGLTEVARSSIGTLRLLLWKVGAVVRVSARRVWLQVSANWPGQQVWARLCAAGAAFAAALLPLAPAPSEVVV